MDFDLVMGGVQLSVLVVALVEIVKAFGLKDKVLLGVSLGIGLVVGGLFYYTSNPSVTGPTYEVVKYWAGLVAYGIMTGATASGLYKAGSSMIGSGLRKFSDSDPEPK